MGDRQPVSAGTGSTKSAAMKKDTISNEILRKRAYFRTKDKVLIFAVPSDACLGMDFWTSLPIHFSSLYVLSE